MEQTEGERALPLKGRWIFLAEDEVMISLCLKEAFEEAGAHVATAFTIDQALMLLSAQNWSGAVLDYALHDEDCTPICEWFGKREIPFIVCTGYDQIGEPCSGGVRMPKPVTAEEVVNTMMALVP